MKPTTNSTQKLLKSAQTAIGKHHYNEAYTYLKQALNFDPLNIDILHNIGVAAFSSGRIIDAIEYFHKASEIKENDPQILYNYASALLEFGRYSDALKIFGTVLNLIPDHIPALNKSCSIVGKMGNATLAEKICYSIIEKDPKFVEAYNNLANACKDQGRIEEAITHYRKALEIKPDFLSAASNLLLCLNYSTSTDQQTIFEEHKGWEIRSRRSITVSNNIFQQHSKDKPKINIGYVSADFRIHSAGYFIEPIIKNHDKKEFGIFCYADVATPDSTTERIKQNASAWRPIYNLPHNHIIQMIADDEIDILVDLSGHSGNNRLPVFLQKPAPIQVTYLGYPNTTGLSTIDYRITDNFADTKDQDSFYTENLYRLSDHFLCYQPPDNPPSIDNLPATKNGFITFGSFNNLPKINSETIKTWSAILHAVPGSKLTIKTKPFNDTNIIESYQNQFMRNDIERERLMFLGHSPSKQEHLNQYNHIDIALDTFPYNGTTTTFEALFMGVPVITVAGECHAGRVGNSILNGIGLPQLISPDLDSYVKSAASWASDYDRLSKLRLVLRDTLLLSQLCDGKNFTIGLEKAYKEMFIKFRNR